MIALFWLGVSLVGLVLYATGSVATFHTFDRALLGVGDCHCHGKRRNCIGAAHMLVPWAAAFVWPSLVLFIPLVFVIAQVSKGPARWGAYLGSFAERKEIRQAALRQQIEDRDRRIAELERELLP